METKNQYEERAKRTFGFEKSSDLAGETSQTGNKKDEIMDLIKNVALDAGISIIGGGCASALLGRLSLPVGIALTTYAHHKKNNHLRTLGIGIMASSSMTNRVKPKLNATMSDNIMERLKAFGEDLKNRLCLDLLERKVTVKKEVNPNPRTEITTEKDIKGTEVLNNPSTVSQNAASESKEKKQSSEGSTESDYLNINLGASPESETATTMQGCDEDEPNRFINVKGLLF